MQHTTLSIDKKECIFMVGYGSNFLLGGRNGEHKIYDWCRHWDN